jgi:hypothetical protein
MTRQNKDDGKEHDDHDISKAEILATATAVKLANHVYKAGDLEPWVSRDGFVLRAEGVTKCTRWYVCDKVERRPRGAGAGAGGGAGRGAGVARAGAGAGAGAGAEGAGGDVASTVSSSSSSRGRVSGEREREMTATAFSAPGRSATTGATAEEEEREEVTTQRWVVVRGAAWNNDAVDRVQLSMQISKAWPTPLHPGGGPVQVRESS